MKPTIVRFCNIAFALIFSLATFWLLAVDGANYLRKIDLLSIFISTKAFFNDFLAYPGGVIVWCATFLTQTFYHPWLGALVYILLLLAMAWLALEAFGLRRSLFPATLLLPAAVLLAFLNFGYIIFSIKSLGFAFVLPLAVDICLLAFWGYRRIASWTVRLALMVIIPVAGYCLMGFYGMLLTGMCAAFELACLSRTSKGCRLYGLVLAAIGVAAIIVVPKVWFMLIGGDLPIALTYRYPLPYFYAGEGSMWVPYIVIFGLMIAGGIIPALKNAREKGRTVHKGIAIGAAAMGVAAIAGIFVLRYADRNFRLTLDLDHAIADEQWQQALDIISANQDIEPTRVNVVLTYIALHHLGRAPHQTFKMRAGSAPYATTRHLRATHDIVAMPLAYHMGLANYAYRWAVEYEVEYGRSIERLKYMVKSALLNGDFALARKSLDNLSKTTFHKKWAQRYYPYLDDPKLMKDDPEIASILPLLEKEDKYMDDNNQLEGYVWKARASIERGSFQSLELALTSSLICFRPDLFAELAPIYARNVQSMPVHFQEGVLMWSLINDSDYHRQFRIDEPVMRRFELFKQTLDQTSSWPDEMRKERMYQMFGDTYWYYCMFVDNLKVI